MSDFEEESNPPANEGVRILGAQEAIAFERAREGGDDPVVVSSPEPEVVVVEPVVETEPAPVWTDEGPSWTAAEVGDVEPVEAEPVFTAPVHGEPVLAVPADYVDEPTAAMPAVVIDGPTAEAPELPHWSEPATGQIPAVFVTGANDAADPTGDTGPRFRSDSDDWSDADFAAALARSDDDDLDDFRLGVSSATASEPIDDDAAFVAAVRARRRAGTRAVVTSTPEARPRPVAAGRRPAATRTAPDNELDAELLPAAGGRDLSQAILTAAIFGTIALVCFKLGPGWTAALASAVLGMCAFEMCSALQSKGLRPAMLPVVIGSAITPLVALRGPDVRDITQAAAGFSSIAAVGTLVTITSMLWFLFKAGPGRAVVGVATSIMTFAYIGGLGGYAGMLLQRGGHGIGLLLGTLLCVIAYDVTGYFVGSKIGNARIAPDVSPNKTVEGTLAGVCGSMVVGALVFSNLAPWNIGKHSIVAYAVAGFLIGVAALLGDLCESMLKRDLGVKDFGSVLPGHGGFLDRFDGLLFALPVAYFVALSLNIF